MKAHFKNWQLIPGSATSFPCIKLGTGSILQGRELVINEPNGSPGHVYEDIARLLAGAPDLLNAVEFLLMASTPQTAQQRECWPVLIAAVAKAGGTTPLRS